MRVAAAWKSSSAFLIHSVSVALIQHLSTIDGIANQGVELLVTPRDVGRFGDDQVDGEWRAHLATDLQGSIERVSAERHDNEQVHIGVAAWSSGCARAEENDCLRVE